MKRTMPEIIVITIVVLLFLVPVVIIYLLNFGNPYTKFLVNHFVPKHLEELGYSEEMMLEAHYIEPKMLINKDFYHGHYMVIFEDERDTAYYYGLTKEGKNVFQFCEHDQLTETGMTVTTTEGIYHEATCVNMLDNRE